MEPEAMGNEAVELLCEMVRFDTTNPPGNELPLAEALAQRVEAEGLSPEVIESAPQRGNLAIRLRGDGSQRPLLLMSHLDVVPAEADRWTHPPFGGTVSDGYVWGRGSIDSKLTTATQLAVLLACKRSGVRLKRDLVLVAAADEELGGVYGIHWLVANRPGLFDAEFGINEGGGFALLIDGKPFYVCQAAEKGSAELNLVATGKPGHSSVPHDDNAIFSLARALNAIRQRKPRHRVTDTVRAFFERAADAQDRPEVADLLRAVLDPGRHAEALEKLPVNEATRLMFDAMIRNTCAPTLLESGVKRNVIPSEATAKLSGRPLPGATEATFLDDVREMGCEGVSFQMEKPFRAGLSFSHETPLFGAIEQSMARHDPGAVVVPYMQTGGTDARALTHLDIHVYGFVPMRYEQGEEYFELCHGHDERVSVDNVGFATRVLYDVVSRLNGVGPTDG